MTVGNCHSVGKTSTPQLRTSLVSLSSLPRFLLLSFLFLSRCNPACTPSPGCVKSVRWLGNERRRIIACLRSLVAALPRMLPLHACSAFVVAMTAITRLRVSSRDEGNGYSVLRGVRIRLSPRVGGSGYSVSLSVWCIRCHLRPLHRCFALWGELRCAVSLIWRVLCALTRSHSCVSAMALRVLHPCSARVLRCIDGCVRSCGVHRCSLPCHRSRCDVSRRWRVAAAAHASSLLFYFLLLLLLLAFYTFDFVIANLPMAVAD
jgi:hypothetical protein